MRILIADDNELVRRGICGVLSSEPDWEICGEASDGPSAVQKAREVRPDVILLDVSMPRLSGFETARQIRHQLPAAKILIISQDDPAALLPSALQAGADGCLDKAVIAHELIPAIKKLRAENKSTIGET
jgi:DNA-binding NarL/FixJ family response regulator